MHPALSLETEKLIRSWMRHDAGMLRDYLVAGVEDPRLNLQSVFSRHFILRALAPGRYVALMDQEYRFAAVMNWLAGLASRERDAGQFAAVLHALQRGADNAEGLEIPRFVVQTFAWLPAFADGIRVPNYLEGALEAICRLERKVQLDASSLDTFSGLWRKAPGMDPLPGAAAGLSVLEVGCGSANDYRFLEAYGIARLVRYTGMDLCPSNIDNARALFPAARFELGNVFELTASDRTFDLCFAHDLFEHLSLEGLQAAVKEVCRVTRAGLCLGFFNLDEIPEHRVQPVDEYHWNTLSLERMRALFAAQGFTAQVLHVGSFLRQRVGCQETHNPNAYTLILSRSEP